VPVLVTVNFFAAEPSGIRTSALTVAGVTSSRPAPSVNAAELTQSASTSTVSLAPE
jgi:hypothetical protein